MNLQFTKLKNKAKRAFLNRQYTESLALLSLIPQDSLSLKESLQLRTLCTLADMATEHEEESRALFEYYHSLSNGSKKPEEIVLQMLDNLDKMFDSLNLFFIHSENLEIDKNNGILYADFQALAHKIGFKEAFINLMFSSKIIFTKKRDFLMFMQDLVRHGFKEIAINYFENIGDTLYFDKDFAHFYQKILQN